MEIRTIIHGKETILELLDEDLNNCTSILSNKLSERIFSYNMNQDNEAQVNQASPTYERKFRDRIEKQKSNLILIPSVVCGECGTSMHYMRTLKGLLFEHPIESSCPNPQDQYVRFEYLSGIIL